MVSHTGKIYLLKKEWCERNKEKLSIYAKSWSDNNKEKKREINKRYRLKNAEEIRDRRVIYLNKNKDKVNKWGRNAAKKRRNTPQGRIMDNTRRMVSRCLTGIKNGAKTRDLIWYTSKELCNHLEKLFTPEMSWENYGTYWHVDHIIPVSSFNFKNIDDDDFKKCWGLENLRPLEARENKMKYNKIMVV